MEVIDCIKTRRSVRRYKSDEIPKEILTEIIEAACCAPSGVNYQPWYFAVLHTKESMAEFRNIMRQVAEKTRPKLEKRFASHPEVVKETESFLVSLGGAPACVLAFMLKNEYEEPGHTALQSIAAGIQNLLLAARDKGIGSCWMTAPVNVGYSDMLRQKFAPHCGDLIAAISLGYPDQEPRMPPRKDGRYGFM